jgi:hypothetical protein
MTDATMNAAGIFSDEVQDMAGCGVQLDGRGFWGGLPRVHTPVQEMERSGGAWALLALLMLSSMMLFLAACGGIAVYHILHHLIAVGSPLSEWPGAFWEGL